MSIQDPFAVFLTSGERNPCFIAPNDFMRLYPVYLDIQLAASRPDVVLEQTIRAAQAQADVLNANLKTTYLAQWNAWLAGWIAGAISDPATAPKPPASFVVIEVPTGPDPRAPKVGAVDQSGPPVVPMPPIPPHEKPPGVVIHVGLVFGNGYWHVGADDTFLPGQITGVVTSDDGQTGRFERFGSAFSAGLYLLLP